VPRPDWEQLVEATLLGQHRALARLVTRVENREPGWQEAMKRLYPHTGNSRVIGITGSPGAGKSSLTNRLAAEFAARGHKVGIIAVDPSSPFSGGALLGDRLRMRDVALTENVYIRSMATRGSLGGLCQGARDVSRILDAAGHDLVLVETVGVGQDEIEIVKAADLVAVLCVPGQGDGVQALKAGVMEIADLFVINKADRAGADDVWNDISAMLALADGGDAADTMIFRTDALSGKGVPDLANALQQRLVDLLDKSEHRSMQLRNEIMLIAERELTHRLRQRISTNGQLDQAVEQITSRLSDPYSAAEALIAQLGIMEITDE